MQQLAITIPSMLAMQVGGGTAYKTPQWPTSLLCSLVELVEGAIVWAVVCVEGAVVWAVVCVEGAVVWAVVWVVEGCNMLTEFSLCDNTLLNVVRLPW